MKIRILIFILVVLILNFQNVLAEENEYGIVKAWFNGKNATTETVEGVKLRIGEHVEIKAEIMSKVNGHVSLMISEPGATNAFDVLNGPSKQDDRIDNLNIESGWSKTYTWTLVSNGAWKNGNAPLNIFVEFDKIENGKIKGDKKIQFTIANPYILDERYTGASQTPQPTAPGATAPKAAPFLSEIGAIAALITVVLLHRKSKL